MSKYIKSIHGFNFAGYSSVQINLSEHSNYLIGPNGAGKSKLGLDILWFVFQGIAEMGREGKQPLIGDRYRFIGPEGATALGEIVIHDDVENYDVRVVRKLLKGSTELSFSGPLGMELDQKWLNELFNLFLIAPKKFLDLSSRDQSKALGIDTSPWDGPIADLKLKFTEINKELTKLNKLPVVEKADRPPLELLQTRKGEIREIMAQARKDNQTHNKGLRDVWNEKKQEIDKEVRDFNNEQAQWTMKYNRSYDAVQILRSEGAVRSFFLTTADQEFDDTIKDPLDSFLAMIKSKMKKPMAAEYPPEPTYIDEDPDEKDMIEIDRQIVEAAGQNEKAVLYEQYLQQMTDKGILELQLDQNKKDQADQFNKMIDYIKAFKFPFKELSVDEEGGLLLFDKPLRPQYFSSGELLSIIPSLFASRNPDFKYVFIQDANLMDPQTLKYVEERLVSQGFQIVFEIVGMAKLQDKNCILLRDRAVVHDEKLMKFLVKGKHLTWADQPGTGTIEISNDSTENEDPQ